MKPLISYYGGKQRMAGKIVPLIPPHTVYVEPFAGGASVLFFKPKPHITNKHHYREVLNDNNTELIELYRISRANPVMFSDLIKATPFAAAIHRSSLQPQTSPIKRAQAKYIRHNQSFANLDRGGFRRETFGRNSATTWSDKQDSVLLASRRLSDVIIDCEDAVKVIKYWDSPQTFFYIDPPYLGTHCAGMGTWTLEDAARLCACLNMCRGSWAVSGYNELRGLLKEYKRLSFASNCTATRSGKSGSDRNHGEPKKGVGRERTEQLYMRGPTAHVRSSLIPILEKQTCFTGPLLGPCPLPLETHPSARKAAPLSK